MDLFSLIGTWHITSEVSEEHLRFLSDGSYRIFYEMPFRMIEVGDWSVHFPLLFMTKDGIAVKSKIVSLTSSELVLSHLDEHKHTIVINYKRVII